MSQIKYRKMNYLQCLIPLSSSTLMGFLYKKILISVRRSVNELSLNKARVDHAPKARFIQTSTKLDLHSGSVST